MSQSPRSAASEPGQRSLQLLPFSFWLQHAPPQATTPVARQPVTSPAEPGVDSSCRDYAAATNTGAGRSLASLTALQQAMVVHLAELGHPGAEPLRWAITGVDPQRGLRLEGIGLSQADAAAGTTRSPVTTADGIQERHGIAPAVDPA